VVIAILSSVLLIALPKMDTRTSAARLSGSARRVSAMVSELHSRSAFAGKNSVLRISIEKNTYSGLVETGSGELQLLSGGAGKQSHNLLRGVAFEDVVAGNEVFTRGVVDIKFSPYGIAENVIVHLVNREMDRCSVVVNPFTGRALIKRGYVRSDE